MVFVLSLLRSKKLSVDASSDSSFTSDSCLFDNVFQAVEGVNLERVDMSTSSVVGEVAGILQGREDIGLAGRRGWRSCGRMALFLLVALLFVARLCF
jgi:hypothetical protein